MKNKDFRYRTRFSSIIYASNDIKELDFHSSASLESLKGMLPYDVDLSKNVDLIPVAFDAAIINQFNKNDDGISSATANRIKEYFIHKPTNIEHDRSRIIGHVTNAAFTTRGEHDYINGDEAVRKEEPYNLSLGGVVYKLIDENFTDILSNALATKRGTNEISASWELGFNTFGVAIGGENLKDCTVVTDPIKVAALAPHLKSFGGDGYSPDGQRIRRLIIGDVFPLGIGFTEKPAANVQGVYANDPFEKYQEEAIVAAKVAKEEDLGADNVTEISQSENLNVKTHNEKPIKLMDFKEQIKAALKECGIDKISEETLAGVQKDIVDAVKEANETYIADKEAAIKAQAKAEENLKNVETSLKEVNEKLDTAEKKIERFEKTAEEEAIASSREERMEQIDTTYELDDEDRKVVLADLTEFDPRDEEKFNAYASRLAILWKDKDKETIAANLKKIEEEVEAKVKEKLEDLDETKASEKETEEEVQKAAASAKTEEEKKVVNKSEASLEEKTLEDKYKEFFKDEDVKVSF
jgi:hypothetical protein